MADHTSVVPLSSQYNQMHRALLAQLAAGRHQFAVGMDLTSEGVESPVLLADFLSACAALHRHASSEDCQLVPLLRAAEPTLAPALDSMVLDHILVRSLVVRVIELVDRGAHTNLPKVLREVDGLAVILESHMDYEEERFGAALDTLGPGPWTRGVLTPSEATPDVAELAGCGSAWPTGPQHTPACATDVGDQPERRVRPRPAVPPASSDTRRGLPHSS